MHINSTIYVIWIAVAWISSQLKQFAWSNSSKVFLFTPNNYMFCKSSIPVAIIQSIINQQQFVQIDMHHSYYCNRVIFKKYITQLPDVPAILLGQAGPANYHSFFNSYHYIIKQCFAAFKKRVILVILLFQFITTDSFGPLHPINLLTMNNCFTLQHSQASS